MEIEHWRQEIDRIDQEILRLLNQRAKCALEIGRIKRSKGKPICDPEREEELLASLMRKNTGPFPKAVVEQLFRKIISACRMLEEKQNPKRR